MNGDEIDSLGEVAVAQPVFPDVGIGDRHRRRRFDLAQDLGDVERRQFAAQQHLVADHDRGDHVGIAFRQSDGCIDPHPVLLAVAAEPQALDHLEPDPLGDGGDLIEAVLIGIGAHASGQAGELGEIRLDLLGRHLCAFVERAVVAAERCVGQTLDAARVGGCRRRLDRAPEPPPGQGDGRERRDEEAGSPFHAGTFHVVASATRRYKGVHLARTSAACQDLHRRPQMRAGGSRPRPIIQTPDRRWTNELSSAIDE